MKVLLDTNILVRAAQPNSPDWSSIEQALSKLIGLGGKLCLVPQNLYEFWVVATRSTNVNGFGLDATAAASMIDDALTRFQLMRDERGVFDNWLNLIQVNQILGKTAHDTRLVAAMQRHSIPNILTFNKGDFLRFPISIFTPADIISGVIPQS